MHLAPASPKRGKEAITRKANAGEKFARISETANKLLQQIVTNIKTDGKHEDQDFTGVMFA